MFLLNSPLHLLPSSLSIILPFFPFYFPFLPLSVFSTSSSSFLDPFGLISISLNSLFLPFFLNTFSFSFYFLHYSTQHSFSIPLSLHSSPLSLILSYLPYSFWYFSYSFYFLLPFLIILCLNTLFYFFYFYI